MPQIKAADVVKHRLGLASRRLGTASPVPVLSRLIDDSFTLPVVARLRSASNGAHSRRCAGSVIASQTFAGGCRKSRTRTSVQFSPSL